MKTERQLKMFTNVCEIGCMKPVFKNLCMSRVLYNLHKKMYKENRGADPPVRRSVNDWSEDKNDMLSICSFFKNAF